MTQFTIDLAQIIDFSKDKIGNHPLPGLHAHELHMDAIAVTERTVLPIRNGLRPGCEPERTADTASAESGMARISSD